MLNPNASYRDSHTNKGADYHRTFSEWPYRELIWEMERQALDSVLETMGNRSISFLDFACGTGRVLAHVSRHVDSATGVDVSASMLETARETARESTFVQGDITRESVFAPESFDLITAFRFFPNAEPELRNAVMEKLVGYLRADGYLVLNNHRNVRSIRSSLRLLLRRSATGMSHEEVVELTRRYGLIIEHVHHMGFWPGSEFRALPPMWLLKKLERFLARVRPLSRWASNLVYVCRKAPSAFT